MADQRLYWLGSNLVKGIGAVRFRSLLNAFGDARTAWEASPLELPAAGLQEKLAENMLNVRSRITLEKVWERLQSQGVQLLTWDDEACPRRLKEIDPPAPVLYGRGDLQTEAERAVAGVSTRRLTASGRRVAEQLAGTQARNAVTVVSGMNHAAVRGRPSDCSAQHGVTRSNVARW